MTDLSKEYLNLKNKYSKIFTNCVEEIDLYLRQNYSVCLDDLLSNDSKDKTEIIKDLSKKIKNDINTTKEKAIALRKESTCIGCGICCKFAVSEFSPIELNEKAKNGDNYAKQFLSVFIPYSTRAEANLIFPEYVSMLEKFSNGKYYFYHCPKVTKDNRCPEYEKRPQICKDFPDNPIGFLPINCGYNKWKNSVQDLLLKSQAQAEILNTIRENYFQK
jgi:Fe-S-cluster containining protein